MSAIVNKEVLDSIDSELIYDAWSGDLLWKNKGNKVAGCLDKTTGYIRVGIGGQLLSAAKVAWYLWNKAWPLHFIDHINGNRADNRIINLRTVTPRMNAQNRVEHRAGHLQGIAFQKRSGKYISRIHINGERKYLGQYNTPEEAHNAYLNALEVYNKETDITTLYKNMILSNAWEMNN